MHYRSFGRTGWQVSEVGFGAWAIGGGWGRQDDGDSIQALRRALDLGVNFIDTAQGYGGGHSERLIGQVVKDRSDKVYVATKTPPIDGTWPPSPYDTAEERYPEAYLRGNIEERLQSLGTDVIDILQLHTWTRAWNRNPKPLEVLHQLKKEGKLRAVGISTPEHDQNCVIELMRAGLLDCVQVIYNIFEQEPAAQLLPVAEETGTAVIVRVAFDEGVLTGKYTQESTFPEDDFRHRYFAGDRLARSVERVEQIRQDLTGCPGWSLTLPQTALKFALQHPAVSAVIPGIRGVDQAEQNIAVSDLPELSTEVVATLRTHLWRRGFWYGGK